MNQSNKVLASVAGVCITTAVVIGAVLGARSDERRTPQPHPAGNPAPIASTVTVTAAARPAAVTSNRAASSSVKAVAPVHRKRQRAAVNKEPAVTEPTTATSSVPAQPDPVNLGTGTVDEGGVRRAPVATDLPQPPPAPVRAPHPSPSSSTS